MAAAAAAAAVRPAAAPWVAAAALATSRPRRLGSRPLLHRRTSLRRAATRGRGRSAGLLRRLGLSTPRLRSRRPGVAG